MHSHTVVNWKEVLFVELKVLAASFSLFVLISAAALLLGSGLGGLRQERASAQATVEGGSGSSNGMDWVDLVFELQGFDEDRQVFLFTAPGIEGQALCLTQNAKVCEQMLDFATGEILASGAYLPKNAEYLGSLDYQAGGMSGSGPDEGWVFTPPD